MKIIEIKGGLGNQMFQYAYGKSLISKGEKVIYNTSFFQGIESKDTKRVFLLDKFNIDPSSKFESVKKNIFENYLQKIFSKVTGNYGFFQKEIYFKHIEDAIRKEFTLKESFGTEASKYSALIENNKNSISLHVRRGDYVLDMKTNYHHGTCGLDYYEKAIDYIKNEIESPTFFIFSDDIKWVKENLKLDNVVYVSNPKIQDYEELILMSRCEHYIIANSSFSWWGAWLNPKHDKIVVAPKQWTVKKTADQLDILPKAWIQI